MFQQQGCRKRKGSPGRHWAAFLVFKSIKQSLPSNNFKDLTYCIQRFDENQDLQKETLRNRTRLRDDDNGLASVLIHTFTTLSKKEQK